MLFKGQERFSSFYFLGSRAASIKIDLVLLLCTFPTASTMIYWMLLSVLTHIDPEDIRVGVLASFMSL